MRYQNDFDDVDVDGTIEGQVVNEAALATINHGLDVMPAISIEQAIERYEMFKKFVNKVLEPNTDYGTIPGTNKDTLYKSGAEKLCMFFGLSVRLRLIQSEEDWTGENHSGEPLFAYRYACDLYKGDKPFATSEGSCSSLESKYRWRQGKMLCPECGKPTIIKGREDYGGGWLCWKKPGKSDGCGAKFNDGDRKIEGQSVERIPNPDIADQVNTIQKMAQKRAFVGTTLLAVNASAYFTQDMEDMPRNNHDPEPPVSKGTAKPPGEPEPPTRRSGKMAQEHVVDKQTPEQEERDKRVRHILEACNLLKDCDAGKLTSWVNTKFGVTGGINSLSNEQVRELQVIMNSRVDKQNQG